jgi:phosphoribosylformylglycinamidine cyclo-ligase
VAGLTYKDAGVDVAAGNRLASRIGALARRAERPEVLSGIGGFAGVCRLPAGLVDPVLVSGTDGVGTKLKVAFLAGEHRSVGIDLVAMCVNDILTVGAMPLFFLDYYGTGCLDQAVAERVIEGIVEGCVISGCALLGGETAELPGLYQPGEYDLAGFVVGVAERERLIDGSRVRPGDVVVGLPSSGLHSNGYSLARRVLLDPWLSEPDRLSAEDADLGCSLLHELLKPTRIYVDEVKALLARVDVRAMAHITGGGLVENPPRVIPEDLGFRLDTRSWPVPKVMDLIARRGQVAEPEMYRTFNMGLGMLVVVPAEDADAALAVANGPGSRPALVVGEIVSRSLLRDGSSVEFC